MHFKLFNRSLAALSVCLCVSTTSWCEAVDFERDIQPVFAEHCLHCHGEDEQESSLRLDRRANMLTGGDSGIATIVPGKPEKSLLVDVINHVNEDMAMPPDANKLPEQDIATLTRWIDEGAIWPGQMEDVAKVESDHWAFQKVTRPPVPKVDDSKNPIDAFLRYKLHQNGLDFSRRADARSLIRRASIVLTGLAPTPEETSQFLSDYDADSNAAYADLVERLLASPHFGERWAQHWLDVIRWAETNGSEANLYRKNAWFYRDYVVRSFNDDVPYDQFLREQIAGDTLGVGEATGFLVAGPHVPAATVGREPAAIRQARADRMDEIMQTVGVSIMGVTIGCARCHNHKFDPVTQHDYYALQAVFAAVDRADQAYDPDPQVHQQRRELLRRQFELENERRAFDAEIQRLAGDELKSLDQKISQLESSTQGNERPEFGWHSGIEPRDSAVKWVQVDLGRTVKLDRVAIVGCHDTFNNIGARFGFPVRFRVELSDDATFGGESRVLLDRTNADVPNPGVEPQVISADGAAGRYVRVTATRLSPRQNDFIFALGELQAFDEQGSNVALNAAVTSLDSIEAPVRWARKNLTDGYHYGMGRSDEAKQQLATMRRERESLVANALVPERRARRAKVEAELTDIDARLKQLPAPSLVYSAATQFKPQGNFKPTGGEPREIRLLRRGNVVMPDEVVEPGSLAAMPTLADHFELSGDGNEGERRAALANWLTDVRNPLTWRTIVNRVWLYHFGRGLVDTPNDFGRMGQMPTHPELLDWMAVEFRDGEQSLKQLHRLICNSATYRQSSADRDECSSVDADNRWLWRMNRRRLDAESIRDAVLLVSGSLDTKMYGPGFQDFVIEKPEHSPH
ncbi:MAG: DUF1549 domain-containing protein [Planctomycetales bacterium]|nr:DUF1549 domain-containing protein [Planctomycetales bacterium]